VSTARFALVALVLCAVPRQARAVEDPDTEIARRHYERGLALYDARDYRSALSEFEAARQTHPAPELTFNIARCHDRLEERRAAAEGYEEYLRAQPYSPDAAALRARIAELAVRDGLRPGSPAPSGARPHRRIAAPVTLAVTAVVVAAVAGGLLGGAEQQYDGLKQTCSPCTVSRTAPFLQLAGASYGLFAGAGAIAIVDVGLWIAAARR
jgi:hypothetical protein